MSERNNLLDALKRIEQGDAWHGLSLEDILSDIDAEQAAARAIPDGHSIWELVLHIAAWEEVFCDGLEGKKMDQPADGDFPNISQTSQEAWTATRTRLSGAHKRLLDLVTRLSDLDLEANLAGKDYSVAFLLHGVIRHHVYHAGQIGLLKKIGVH